MGWILSACEEKSTRLWKSLRSMVVPPGFLQIGEGWNTQCIPDPRLGGGGSDDGGPGDGRYGGGSGGGRGYNPKEYALAMPQIHAPQTT